MNSPDTLSIICSFLQPLELCRLRSVGKYYTPIVDQWVTKTYGEICVEEWACPQCGDLLDQSEITYTSFYDVMYGNVDRTERYRYKTVSDFSKYLKSTRVQILCDECENTEEEDPRCGKVHFRFQGNRSYQLFIDRSFREIGCNILPWAFLFYINQSKETLYWNEFRSIISPTPTFQFGDGTDTDDMDDDDDEEDDDEDEESW